MELCDCALSPADVDGRRSAACVRWEITPVGRRHHGLFIADLCVTLCCINPCPFTTEMWVILSVVGEETHLQTQFFFSPLCVRAWALFAVLLMVCGRALLFFFSNWAPQAKSEEMKRGWWASQNIPVHNGSTITVKSLWAWRGTNLLQYANGWRGKDSSISRLCQEFLFKCKCHNWKKKIHLY